MHPFERYAPSHRPGGWGVIRAQANDDELKAKIEEEIKASLATGADHIRLLLEQGIGYKARQILRELIPNANHHLGYHNGWVKVIVCPGVSMGEAFGPEGVLGSLSVVD